jgi:hypothetical protein
MIDEYALCCNAKPRHDAINIQLDKDACAQKVKVLSRHLGWGEDDDIASACEALEPKLNALKEKLVFEILKNGTV